MNKLLTEEERDTIDRVRSQLGKYQYLGAVTGTHAAQDLLAIIDSLQERAQSEIDGLKNGKTIGSLHHKIATLEAAILEKK